MDVGSKHFKQLLNLFYASQPYTETKNKKKHRKPKNCSNYNCSNYGSSSSSSGKVQQTICHQMRRSCQVQRRPPYIPLFFWGMARFAFRCNSISQINAD